MAYRTAMLLAVCVLVLTGCGTPKTSAKASKADTKQNKTTAQIVKEELPNAVTGKGWHLPWYTRDPNNPERQIPVFQADAQTGALTGNTDNITAQLHKVNVVLYRDGKPAATAQAPRLTANRRDKIIVGTGGVRIVSLTDPPDTVITADKIRWDTRTSHIVATGSAHAKGKMKNGLPVDVSGNHITYDIARDEIETN